MSEWGYSQPPRSHGTLPGNLPVHACVWALNARARSQIKVWTETWKWVLCAGPLRDAQISPFLCGARPGFLQWCASTDTMTHTHTHTITDVTRIQEGVAAYYILTAHTGCLAWLALFKRLRLAKQRGFCSGSLLISFSLHLPYLSASLYLHQHYSLPPPPPCRHKYTQKASV